MSTQQAQEQLQNALVTTFLANLAFLSEYDKALYQRVDALSQLIERGEFKENYMLEFIMEDGEFDVYDVKNDKYLYDKKPSKFIKKALVKTDLTSNGSFSIMENQLFQGKSYHVFDEVEYFCSFDYSHKKLANDLTEYVAVFKNNLYDYKFKRYKYINKFMFIGTLLGRHIPLIAEKLKAKNYFVCEENLEIFRLSLFIVDYSNLARDGNTVVFSIMEDTHVFDDKMQSFLSNKGYQNYTIKYFTTDNRVQEYFDHIMNAILAHKGTTFNYHMMLENLWKNVASRISHYNVLQMKLNLDDDILNYPVLFLAAGPSLSDNMTWIKKNAHKFIIVAVGATYKTLLKNGIKPHIVTSLDPQYSILSNKHFDKQSVKKIQDCFFICSINTDERLLKRFDKNKIFLYEMNKPLHSTNKCFKGYSIGEISASIILGLGFKNIYLLGLDFAINQKTGSSHMDEYKNEDSTYKLEINKENSDNRFSFDEELIQVRGNHLEKVYTTRLFSMSLNSMGLNLLDSKKANQKVYNLSNHGAYIEETFTCKPKDLNIESKLSQTIQEELNNYLVKASKDKLSETDRKIIENELTYLLDLKPLIKNFLDNPSKDFEQFDERIDTLVKKIFFPKYYCPFLQVVFVHFFNIILQYVYYCLNNRMLDNEVEKINQAESIFYSQLERMLSKYLEYLRLI